MFYRRDTEFIENIKGLKISLILIILRVLCTSVVKIVFFSRVIDNDIALDSHRHDDQKQHQSKHPHQKPGQLLHFDDHRP